MNILSRLTCLIRFFRVIGVVLQTVSVAWAAAGPATLPGPAATLNPPARSDRDELLDVIRYSSIRYRFRRHWPFLSDLYGPDPTKADFMGKLTSISQRLYIDVPDVLIVNPLKNAAGKPAPKKPDAGVGWANNIHGKNHYLVFVTRYLQEHLTHDELLAVVAHEMKHFRQLGTGFEHRGSKKLEAEADAFALSCPEVDPHDFRNMLFVVEKLQDRISRRHPWLYGDFTGLSTLDPAIDSDEGGFMWQSSPDRKQDQRSRQRDCQTVHEG